MAAPKASKPPVTKSNEKNRSSSLDNALAQIDRQFGKGSIMRLGDDTRPPVEVIPTGSVALDAALGIGGLPRGRIIEIYGPESSGKTTLALHAVANAQRNGGIAAFIDAEHAMDPEYAKKLGVDTDALLVSQPDTGEQALEITDMLIRSGALDVVVIDSVAALVPKAEIEGEMGDSHVGLQARLMSQALRKLTGALSASGTTEIYTLSLHDALPIWPTWESPISPSISALGTSAATESTTTMSSAPERISMSVISRACSPVSGWETSRASVSTPSFLAYSGSSACSASMNAAMPPLRCALATAWRATVVLPEDSGP